MKRDRQQTQRRQCERRWLRHDHDRTGGFDAADALVVDGEIASRRAVLDSYDGISAAVPNSRFLREPRADAKRSLDAYETYKRGLRLLEEGDADGAAKLFGSIAKDHPLRQRPEFQEALKKASQGAIAVGIRKARHAMMNKNWGLARKSVAEVLRLDPFFVLENFGDLFRDSSNADRIISALRKAGMSSK